jgi:hypothetical protein
MSKIGSGRIDIKSVIAGDSCCFKLEYETGNPIIHDNAVVNV